MTIVSQDGLPTMEPVTVHLILQAHLDPIWLWPWQAGLDALLATCRSACDRLDANPDIFFSWGEAWTYWQIERIDPKLFARIKSHVETGRWEIVGGWWIQPDCNIPSGDGMRRQIELGKSYFTDRFGLFPETAFNVDSFGHAATLPTIMHAAGQHQYVMMRPQEHEMALPARLFRWREKPGAPEVVTFRVAHSYCTREQPPTDTHMQACLSELPAGVRHTMCFIGLGDHGGGPTEQLIAWCRDHQNAIAGCRLIFSTVKQFFTAVAPYRSELPLHTGELQMHAVGCYTALRTIKSSLRRSEQLLMQAEVAVSMDPAPEHDARKALTEAWRDVCFNQFHDTLAGTCIPSAYAQVNAQLGRADAVADDLIQLSVRRQMTGLPDDLLQRIVLFNASDQPFDDYFEFEPWLEWKSWDKNWRLLDEIGNSIPYQTIESEALTNGLTRLLIHYQVPASAMRVLRIDRSSKSDDIPLAIRVDGDAIFAGEVGVRLGLTGEMIFGSDSLPLPTFQLVDDPTDTWSHNIESYGRIAEATAVLDGRKIEDSGPLMRTIHQWGRVQDSAVETEYRVFSDGKYIELFAHVFWRAMRKILKLSLPFTTAPVKRTDAILAGHLERPLDGKEYPFSDWTLIELSNGSRIGIVCPDVFGLDCTKDELRLTLLRSPYMAHHLPHEGSPRGRVSDQGEHFFRIRIFYGPEVTPQLLNQNATMLRRPLILADLTRGMPATIE